MFQSRCNATQDATLAALSAVPSSFGPVWLSSDRNESIAREAKNARKLEKTGKAGKAGPSYSCLLDASTRRNPCRAEMESAHEWP